MSTAMEVSLNWRMCKYLALGSLTYVPGLHRLLRRGTGGTNSARYCYSVWLRHLVLNRALLGPTALRSVAELGPGDSLGVGMAALLSGAERYTALDALPHARGDENLRIFDTLVELFKRRVPIPDDGEFPDVNPKLTNYAFPAEILTDEIMARALAPDRLNELRADIRDLSGRVRYRPTWHREEASAAESVDLVLSQAVLEHVDAIDDTYHAMFRWLRPGGVMSHQIDFKCHATADRWNGHLAYSDLTWRLMRGKLPYFINRRAPSDHLAAAASAGFSSITLRRVLREDGLPVAQLAPRFRAMSELDAKSAGGFLQAARPHRSG